MSEFLDVFLNVEEPIPTYNSKTSEKNTIETTPDEKCDDVLVKIKDHEIVNNEYIKFFVEINVKSDDHFWLEKSREKSWTVYRRFREFEDFHWSLVKRYPASLIPPLPSKLNSVNPIRAANQINDTEFIDSRRQRLEWFIKRLLEHPRLKCDDILFAFLRDDRGWKYSEDGNFTEKLGSVVNWRWLNVQTQLIGLIDETTEESTNSGVVQISELVRSGSLCEEARRLVERGNRVQTTCKSLLDSLLRIDEEARSLHLVYHNYGEALYDWCGLTPGNGLQITGQLCDSFSTDSTASATTTAAVVIGGGSGGPGPDQGTLLGWADTVLLLREIADYGPSWTSLAGRYGGLVKKLGRTQQHWVDLRGQLERLRNGQSQKTGLMSSIKSRFQKSPTEWEIQDSIGILESNIKEVEQRIEYLKGSKDLFERQLEEEVRHFDSLYSTAMRLILASYAHNQLVHSERCQRLWQRARQSLNQEQ